MKRVFAFGGVGGALVALLALAACSIQDAPRLGTLVVDVSPDSAHITVMNGADLVDYGYGDVQLAELQPGTYAVTAGNGPHLYTASIEVRARETVTATIQLGDPSTMQLAYGYGPFGPASSPTLSMLRYGPPGGGGGGHGGGNSGGKGGKGDTYGDLWVIYRDADGAPITVDGLDLDGNPVLVDGEPVQCVQPVASYAVDPTNPDPTTELLTLVVSVDGPAPKCEPLEEDLPYLMEVDFGRLNLVRAPSKVLQKAYDAAMATLEASEEAITTDPAGRLVATIDGELKTIDSPLENVALYEHLLRTGIEDGTMTLGTITLPRPVLEVAAALFAAGSDKSGTIDLDEVVYINEFMGLNVKDGDPYYTHYSGYSYDRQNRYGTVRAWVLVPDPENEGSYISGWVNVYEEVFGEQNATGSDARGFAQAANDALQTIIYVHDHPAPDPQPATP